MRCGDDIPLGNLNPGQHTRANMNGLVINVILENESDFVDVILESENGSCVNVILGNGSDSCVGVILENDLGVDVSQIDWIPLHNGPPHYHPFFCQLSWSFL